MVSTIGNYSGLTSWIKELDKTYLAHRFIISVCIFVNIPFVTCSKLIKLPVTF